MNRPGYGTALLIILLVTAALTAIMYLGAQFGLPYVPGDLYDWLTRTGAPLWIGLVNALNSLLVGLGFNLASAAALTELILSAGLFFLLAILVGSAFYLLTGRRGRAPDAIDGITAGLLFGAPLTFLSLIGGMSRYSTPVNVVWLGALFIAWGWVLSYALRRLSVPAPVAAAAVEDRAGEAASLPDNAAEAVARAPAAGQVDRRQFLTRFGLGAAAVTAVSATAGAILNPHNSARLLQDALPVAGADFLSANPSLMTNFRRFAIVRREPGQTESAVVALGAEYPDRHYVSIWLGGGSPIAIYENLETALGAYGADGRPAGVVWLDNEA